MSVKSVEIIPASGTEVFIPLNKLKMSPNNARKTPHSVNRPVNVALTHMWNGPVSKVFFSVYHRRTVQSYVRPIRTVIDRWPR
ncbi:hypothetical protein J4G43_038205 [Bradyrhizobium barranii subsp. barranii]|uniref:Uncharacterized protein n=1 Tax=Bradyrhizobium barranii subsp. barranii TaxID=2823807 RepID=A0A939MC34_9BRAD|nr:hypothetical protein [Bradyrhizobium barranii]UEM17864.1 hypothetical protein J4G43_038205 [Bradyrhizobium barranii subsp. barranii]